MAHVFISCVRADQDRVRHIGERLASLGYSVAWERSANLDVAREINEARAVIVAWSNDARHSVTMCAEATCAFDAGKLVQIRLDGAPAPPFDAMPAFDVGGERPEWGPLEARLAELARTEATTPAKRPSLGLFATATAAGAPKLITIALVTALAAYAGALAEAHNGVMSPDQLQLALTGIIGVAGASAALCVHRLLVIERAGD